MKAVEPARLSANGGESSTKPLSREPPPSSPLRKALRRPRRGAVPARIADSLVRGANSIRIDAAGGRGAFAANSPFLPSLETDRAANAAAHQKAE
jgi:hypothetical protein